MRKLLNSRLTWIILPVVMTALMYLAVTSALMPVSGRSVDRLLTQLNQNALNDPKIPWKHLTPADDNFVLSTNTSMKTGLLSPYQSLSEAGAYEKYTIALAEEKPLQFAGVDSAVFSDVQVFIKSNPRALLVGGIYPATHYVRLLHTGAVIAARSGDHEKAMNRLRLMAQLARMTLERYAGINSRHMENLYSAFEDVAAATTNTIHLQALSDELERTRSVQHPTRPTLGSAFLNLMNSRHWEINERNKNVTLETITNRARLLAISHPYAHQQTKDGDWNGSNRGGMRPFLAWTRNLYLFKRAMHDLAQQTYWKQLVPEVYLEGLSEDQKLMAVALLLEPIGTRQRSYLTSRANATKRAMLQAAMLARVYYSNHSKLPANTQDLTGYGFQAPAPTKLADINALLSSMKTEQEIADRDEPLGPLEFVHLTPGADDINQWLKPPYGTKVILNAVSDIDAGSTSSRWLVSLEREAYGGGPHTYETGLADWIKHLDSRPEVHVTSNTLLKVPVSDAYFLTEAPTPVPAGTLEFIIPNRIIKIQLSDPKLDVLFPKNTIAVHPFVEVMFVAPPVPEEIH